MTAEAPFLVASVRRFLHPDLPLPELEGLDWNALSGLAWFHSVEPLLYLAVRDLALPAGVREQLHERFQGNARFSMALSAELLKLVSLFKQERIAAISLKGPVLGSMLYGSMGLRTSSDIDVLIQRRDAIRLRHLLPAHGYRLDSTLHAPADSACLRARERQLSFQSANGLSVDVHWSLLPGWFPDNFDTDLVWRDLQFVPFGGAGVPALSPKHQLLYLCAHGAKHSWERLGWICDVARLLQAEPELDWPEILAEARQTHTSRILALGLILSRDFLGVALPAPAAELVASHAAAIPLARQVESRIQSGPGSLTAREASLFSLRAFERSSQRVRYVAGSFIGPSEAEYRVLKLPPGLFWFYYLFRPVRLLYRWVGRLSISARRGDSDRKAGISHQ